MTFEQLSGLMLKIVLLILSVLIPTLIYLAKKARANEPQKSVKDAQRELNSPSLQAIQNAGDLLMDQPDLCEEHRKPGMVQEIVRGQVVSKAGFDVFYKGPVVKIAKDRKSFAISFSKDKSATVFRNYTKYIASVFYANRLIESDTIVMTPTPDPYVLNYRVLPPKEKLLTNNIDRDPSKYKQELSKLKKNEVEVLVGEVRESGKDLIIPGVQRLSLRTSPHFLIAGQTRSGKTKSALSLITSLAVVYPESIGWFYFADGKNSPDYDSFAGCLSKYNVAKKISAADTCAELASLVKVVWKEYQRRKDLMEEVKSLGFPCSTYLEMENIARENNLGPKYILPRAFVFVDEFASFVADAPDAITSLIETEGSIYYYISRLLRESASFGFTLCLMSQRIQATDFAPAIKANLTTWLIHAVQSSDAKYLELEGIVEKQSAGEFILRYPGLKCEVTGENNIPCKLPYVGDNPQMLKNLPSIPHEPFDTGVLYTRSSKTSDLSKLEKIELAKYIKGCFLAREGFEVIEEGNPEFDYIVFRFKHNDTIVNIGLADSKELEDEAFFTRVKRLTAPDVLRSKTYWFATGMVNEKKQEKIQTILDANADDIFFPQDWDRNLRKAFSFYNNDSKEPVFRNILSMKATDMIERVAELEVKEENSRKNVIISIQELDRIAAMKGGTDALNAAKGEAFELFVHALYSLAGYKVISPSFLFESKLYTRPGDTGDLGIDALFIKTDKDKVDLRNLTKEESDSRVAVQIKNWNSDLPAKVLGEVLRAQKNFKCLTTGEPIKNGMVIVSGDFTSYTELEAKNQNIGLVGHRQLVRLIKELTNKQEETPVATVVTEESQPVDIKTSIKALLDLGKSQNAIAKELGISPSTVNKHAKLLSA